MSHKIQKAHAESISGLYHSLESIEVYRKGFNDGVDSVIGTLRNSLNDKAKEAAESLGIDFTQYLLDPVNGVFEPRVAVDNQQRTQRQVADPVGAPEAQGVKPTPQQRAELENIRRAKAAKLKRRKELEAELAKLNNERELSKEKLEELDGQANSFKPPMAKPLHSNEVPLESDLTQGRVAQAIDKRVDAQVDDVLAAIKERNLK